MRGHERIMEMREQGFKPKIVFLNDWPCETNWFETGEHVTISTDGDSIDTLDLRFLIGCTVSISSETESRAKGLFELCKQAKAQTVAACHTVPQTNHWQTKTWAEIWSQGNE